MNKGKGKIFRVSSMYYLQHEGVLHRTASVLNGFKNTIYFITPIFFQQQFHDLVMPSLNLDFFLNPQRVNPKFKPWPVWAADNKLQMYQ